MATTCLAFAGTAAALYAYKRVYGPRLDEDRPTLQSHTNHHRAPNNWVEALYFFTETMRLAYSETLGRWQTADLLLGLLYLARREGDVHPASDIATNPQAIAMEPGSVSNDQVLFALEEVATFKRVLSLCCVQRLKESLQPGAWKEIGIGSEDILKRHSRAGVLRPAFSLLRDTKLGAIVLVVRGTHSLKDMFTCLTSAVKPHHMTGSSGVVLGYSHFGMLAAARWILKEVFDVLEDAMTQNPGHQLLVVGHSLGGGTAAMLTMMLRDELPLFSDAKCYTLACPSCMTLELAQSCSHYVTTIVNGADVVPTFSPAAMDRLRSEVAASHWFDDFRQSSSVVRAVEGGIRGVGCATMWTTRQLVWGASLPVHAIRSLPADRLCGGPRRKGSPRSPRHQSTDVMDDGPAPRSVRLGQRRLIGASGSSGDKLAAQSSQEDLEEREGKKGWGGNTRLWSMVNPVGWFKGCSAAGIRRRGCATEDDSFGILTPRSRSRRSSFTPAHDNISVGALEMEMIDIIDVGLEYHMDDVQELEDAIAERCEELSMHPENSMQRDLSDILQEVAVAEQEEAIESASPHSRRKPMSPLKMSNAFDMDPGQVAVDFGLTNGPQDGGPTSQAAWETQRRMYPAGRILHMVPRSALTPPEPHTPSSVSDLFGDYTGSFTQCAEGCEPDMWMELSAARARDTVQQKLDVIDETMSRGESQEGVPSHRASSTGGEDGHHQQDEGLWGSSEADRGFVLLTGVPQQAYGRMKVCRQMIRDHFLPSYLEALDGVQGSLRMSLADNARDGSRILEDYVDPLPLFCHRLRN